MSEANARLLSGTAGATYPFWSTDSREVAFFAEGKLKKVSVASTDVDVICAAPDARGGTWNRAGVILFAPNVASGLQRVDAHGGSPETVTTIDPSHESSHRFPSFLPDGDHFVFTTDSIGKEPGRVQVGSLSDKKTRFLMTAERAPVYAEPGFLVYSIGDRIVAQPFDAKRLEVSGPPVRLPEHPPATVSTNGILVTAAAADQDSRLVWLDRRGGIVGSLALPPGSFEDPKISPDGKQVALSASTGEDSGDLWVVDLERGATTRLTFGPGMNRYPIWSPDGKRLAFQSDRSGRLSTHVVAATGGAMPVEFNSSPLNWKRPLVWSPDGSKVILETVGKDSGYDLWIATTEGKTMPFAVTPATEMAAAISPDGRWVAYESNETGRTEILVQSFPSPGTRYQVTTAGGGNPLWVNGGKELLYATREGKLASVSVTGNEALQFGQQQILFAVPDITGMDTTADGQKFLATMSEDATAAQSFTVVTNWARALK
jgi:Tol biopolymer transport system component